MLPIDLHFELDQLAPDACEAFTNIIGTGSLAESDVLSVHQLVQSRQLPSVIILRSPSFLGMSS